MTRVSLHRTGPTLGICESILIFITSSSSSISKSWSVHYYCRNTNNSEGTVSQQKGTCIFLLKSTQLFLAQQLAAGNAAEDNLGENIGGNRINARARAALKLLILKYSLMFHCTQGLSSWRRPKKFTDWPLIRRTESSTFCACSMANPKHVHQQPDSKTYQLVQGSKLTGWFIHPEWGTQRAGIKNPQRHLHFTGHDIFKGITQQVICNKDHSWERKRQSTQSFVKKKKKETRKGTTDRICLFLRHVGTAYAVMKAYQSLGISWAYTHCTSSLWGVCIIYNLLSSALVQGVISKAGPVAPDINRRWEYDKLHLCLEMAWISC